MFAINGLRFVPALERLESPRCKRSIQRKHVTNERSRPDFSFHFSLITSHYFDQHARCLRVPLSAMQGASERRADFWRCILRLRCVWRSRGDHRVAAQTLHAGVNQSAMAACDARRGVRRPALPIVRAADDRRRLIRSSGNQRRCLQALPFHLVRRSRS
jgi:hypothetical protein